MLDTPRHQDYSNAVAQRRGKRREARMAEENSTLGLGVGQVVGAVLTPPRLTLALLLGAGVFGARAVGQLVEEGERVLERMNGRWGRSQTKPVDAPAAKS